jgi:enamine deaminase RidA (YjgF/YER057c/UK114 family)
MDEKITISSGTPWEKQYGYSRVVRVGAWLEVAGTVAAGEDGKVVGVGSPYEQARFILLKIQRALEAAGASMTNVVRTRMYLTDISMINEVGGD